jgi:hypothetical protein
MKNKIVHHSIIAIFVSLYLLVATISMINSVDFFNLSHSGILSWSLAIGFELGAAASLAAIIILDKTNKAMVWGLFILLTCFQMMANSYHAYSHLENYQGWIELFGLQDEEIISQKRILSIVSGAVLPLVALGFIKSLTDYIKPEVTSEMLHPMPLEEDAQVERPYIDSETGEIEIKGPIMPIKKDIWLPDTELEETQNDIKEDNETEEVSIENIADAELVNIEQEEPQSLNLDTADEDIEVPNPHVTTGKFVSKPKNWGVRIPPHRL